MSTRIYIKPSKLISIRLFIGVLALSFMACNDDFLEKTPETDIDAGSFFNTEEDLNLYVYNLYDFPSPGIYTDDAYNLTDNAFTTGNVELKTMMTTNPSSTTITGGWDWSQLRNVNFFLANFRKANIAEERLNHFEGLGRFFRARFYVDKVKRYSDIPWVDQVVTTDNEDVLFAQRDTRETIVNHILEDYEFAANNVNISATSGEVSRWVVKADYARFLLHEATFRKYHAELNLSESAANLFQKAIDVTKDIMDNGSFSIYTTGKPNEDYANLFANADLSGNPEIIYARFYQANLLNGDTGEWLFGNYETYPLKDLIQAYLMKDGSFYSSQPNYQQNEFVEEFRDRDPRLYQTYAYPGWILVRSGTYAQGTGLYVQQLAKNFSGYHQIKGFYNTTDQDTRNNIDIPLYRFAEILLTYAEAKAELGELTQGDLDMTINKLRDRVGMPHMNLNPPIDPIEAAKFSNIVSGQRAEILEIRRERRVELAFEGRRYDDLMRWETGKFLEKEPQGIYFGSLGKHDLTGDGVPDIYLLPASQSIPNDKETNSLGKVLQYYRVGTFGQDVSLFLGGATSGNIQIIEDMGTFVSPKYYYRPIPQQQITLNPNLGQIFGWQ
ncbi:RagB/SusD family nutrient uptake outer membrane protein [Olivibacter sp. XZL3]|uniref:RagB/SusD family nutrient uptake outer membrane protein n=1 Tax=Olivibacter sp. XZL3 TaxID=1735116 RepID=UPI0010664445|nr:RagB/SusD family nutrient uptake outer membrane protein [Olivibacter sp. XZL3]